jgi:hypothetical protein
MIKYSLGCGKGHEFEAWFGSISAFEGQATGGLVRCPECQSTDVDRRPMAPAIVSRRDMRPASHTVTASAPPEVQAALDKIKALKDYVIAKTDDVGAAFAEEARKIHFGEAEERAIRGQATADDMRTLVEDGIEFGILPALPGEHN